MTPESSAFEDALTLPCPSKSNVTAASVVCRKLADDPPNRAKPADVFELIDDPDCADPVKFNSAAVAAPLVGRTAPLPVSSRVAPANALADGLVEPWPVNAIVPAAFVLRAVRFPAIAEPVRLKIEAAAALPEVRVAPCPAKLKFAAALDDPVTLVDPEPLNPTVPAALAFAAMTLVAAPDPVMAKNPLPCARAEGTAVPPPTNAKFPPADALTGEVAAPPPVKDSVAAVSVSPGVEAPADPVKLIDGVAAMTAKDIPKNRLDVSEPAKVANSGRTREETRPRAKPPRAKPPRAAAPIERQRSAMFLPAYDRRRKTRKA